MNSELYGCTRTSLLLLPSTYTHTTFNFLSEKKNIYKVNLNNCINEIAEEKI